MPRATLPGGNADNNNLRTERRFSYRHIDTNTTTVLKTGAGVLHTISVTTIGSSSTITVYDNTEASGTKIATINSASTLKTYQFDAMFTNGLTVVTAGTGAPKITVTYR